MVATGLGYREWTSQDFAREFLHWVAREYPGCAGRKISASDIDVHLLPRFRANTGCNYLALGSLLRGLGKVTKKTERSYMDGPGRNGSWWNTGCQRCGGHDHPHRH
jgi:hypothetical protein